VVGLSEYNPDSNLLLGRKGTFSVDFTPRLINDDLLQITLNAERIRADDWNPPKTFLPDPTIKPLTSFTTTVAPGEEFVYGGWQSYRSYEETSGVPYLRNIPVAGKLFGNHKEIITPVVLICVSKARIVER
jgi:type II secretory pathway component GspD/PulD (secretin)